MLVLVAGAACRSGQPLLVSTTGDMSTPGTIGGIVSAVGGDRLAGRGVHAVHVGGAERVLGGHERDRRLHHQGPARRVPAGGRPARGEKIVRSPGIVHINKSDLDANLEIVVGS